MAGNTCFCIFLLLSFLALIDGQKRDCTTVSDILDQLPPDLVKLLKSEMDVFAFTGTFFAPAPIAWNNKDLDPTFYDEERLRAILRLSIIPGVRLAERPGLKTGTIQVESRFVDDHKLFCLMLGRPDNEVDVEVVVTGKPGGNNTSRFSLEGTSGSKYRAGGLEIDIVRVYSDIKAVNMTDAIEKVRGNHDTHDFGARMDGKNVPVTNLTNIASWAPAKVVKVVQCEYADVFFVDHVLLPCPMCGKKCSAALVNEAVRVLLPVCTVFAALLGIGGSLALCFGCNFCANTQGVCGCFWKFVCRSLVLIIVLLELCLVAVFAGFAWYYHDFSKKQVATKQGSWKPYFIWAILGAVLTGLSAISQVWSFIAGARQRNARKHQQFVNAPPPPMYAAAGAAPPIRY